MGKVEQIAGGSVWGAAALGSHFDPLLNATRTDLPPLLDRMDTEAAMFLVHGDGPVGRRELEPLTRLAERVLGDPELARRARISLATLDDLPLEVQLTRASFAQTPLAAAGLGLLSDLRFMPKGRSDIETRAMIGNVNERAASYAGYTGYYQRLRSELVYTARSSQPLLGESFGAVVPDPSRRLSLVQAARIAPHELFHGIGLDAQIHRATKVQDGFNEAEASIVGTLRASRTARDLEQAPVGPVLWPDELASNYDPYSRVYSGLARMAGVDLDSPAAVAALEMRMAQTDVRGAASELTWRAAHSSGGSMALIRDAAFAGMRSRDPAAFTARLQAAGIAAPDTSNAWMFVEGTRRGRT